jgi:hypothetical protein
MWIPELSSLNQIDRIDFGRLLFLAIYFVVGCERVRVSEQHVIIITLRVVCDNYRE